MQEKEYLLVEADVLPEVFRRVLQAKELLASGEAKNVSKATQMAGISRSAFYKYKDSIKRANQDQTITITAVLKDETGALHTLLAGLSAAGANVVTINQSMPENGTAAVAVTFRTGQMQKSLNTVLDDLRRQSTVVEIKVN